MPQGKKIDLRKSTLELTRIIFLSCCILIFIFSIAFGALVKTRPQKTENTKKDERCIISGCNGEICQNKDDKTLMSTCLYKPEYECYKKAICEVQENGNCGWTKTKEFQECIESFKK
jgi:eight-cysteine-cluster-containing protein